VNKLLPISIQGCFNEIIGPVLPELVIQTNSTYHMVAKAVSMRGVGHAFGAVLG